MIFLSIFESEGSRLIGQKDEGRYLSLPGLWISIMIDCFQEGGMSDSRKIEL